MELPVGDHVEVAGAGQTEDDGLGLAGLAAFDGLVDGDADGVAGLRRGQDALDARELLGRLEHLRLLDGAGLHVAIVIQLRDDGAHAVVAQAAGVVRRGDEAAAERVHLGQRADFAGVAEVVGEPAAREARAGGGLDGDEPIVALTAQLLAHERGDEAAEVAAAAGAADDYVRHDAVFVEGRFCLQTDDRLVQQHLIEHAAEHVAVAGGRGGDLDGLADRAAERAGRAGVLGEDATADLRLRGRARRHGRAVGAHDLAAEGLLLIRALDHVDLAVEPEVGAGHRQGRAPLAGTGLGRDAAQPLLLGVERLRDGAVELVRAGGVVALKLVIDLCRGLQLLFQAVGAHERRGTVHFVKIADLVRDGDLAVVVVELLTDQLVAEHGAQIVERHRRAGGGIAQRGGLDLHVGADIVPRARHFVLGQVDLVGNVFVCHGVSSFRPGPFRARKNDPCPRKDQYGIDLWDKSRKTSAVPPKLAQVRPLGDVPSHVFPW